MPLKALFLAVAFALAASRAGAAGAPLDAAVMAAADLRALSEEVRVQRRYLWCPNGSSEEHAAAAVAINTAVARTNVDVHPRVLAQGRLIAVDLRVCAPEQEDYERLLSLWASLSDREPYFHVRELARVEVTPYRARDGKVYDYKFQEAAVPAPHLLEYGAELERLVGNPFPDAQSFCPVARLDWWVGEVLGTADGGRYYDFRGLKVGETTLEEYLISRGASQEQARRLDSDERAAFISRVTGKARAVTMFQGAGTRPSAGAAIIAITDDPFDDTIDPRFDPFRELLEARTNGHEVLLTLPSGWIEYTIWNGDKKLVAEAPPNLVADHRIPEPHTTRLQGAISCIRCHASTDQWQPFVNEVALMLGDRARVLGDVNTRDGFHETLRRLAGLYGGDLNQVLKQAQDNFDRRVFAVAGMGAAEACQALARIHNQYEHAPVDAALAVRELGFELDEGDALGARTFRRVVPGETPEDPILVRLRVEYLAPRAGERRGLRNTRRQWEQVYADAMIRALPALLQDRKEKRK